MVVADGGEGRLRWLILKSAPSIKTKQRTCAFAQGDMFQLWSNGRFKSTLHRVVTTRPCHRYSTPFFVHPSHDTVVRHRRVIREHAIFEPHQTLKSAWPPCAPSHKCEVRCRLTSFPHTSGSVCMQADRPPYAIAPAAVSFTFMVCGSVHIVLRDPPALTEMLVAAHLSQNREHNNPSQAPG